MLGDLQPLPLFLHYPGEHSARLDPAARLANAGGAVPLSALSPELLKGHLAARAAEWAEEMRERIQLRPLPEPTSP